MSTLESGNQVLGSATGTIQAQIDQVYGALRTAHRPLDHTVGGKILGHYRVYTPGNAAGAIAAGIQNELRYSGANVLVVSRVYAIASVVTAVTAQAIAPCTCKIIRGATAADSTGGTAATLSATGTNGMRTGMGAIGVGITIYNATAPATVLSGGTNTADSQPFGALAIGSSTSFAAIGVQVQGDLYSAVTSEYLSPVTLQTNEGIQVIWGTTLATGTATLGVGYELIEVAAF